MVEVEELVEVLELAKGEDERVAQNKTGFCIVKVLDTNGEEEDEAFQKNTGCLVDTEAVEVLSPVDCQKSKGDFGEKSNLAGLAEGDWSAGSVVETVGSVAGRVQGVVVVVVVVVGRVAGDACAEVAEALERNNLFNLS